MAIIKCPECGHQVSDKAATCPSCGIEIAGRVMECPDCGTVVFNEQELCPNCHRLLHGHSENGEKPHKRGYVAIVICVVIILIIGLVVAYLYGNSLKSGETDAYTQAMLSDEPAVLQNYLDIYTDAPEEHRDSIEAHLTVLMSVDKEWTDAVVSGSKTAIERYLQMHPNTKHEMEAKIKIDSLDWVAAVQANTPEALQTYMNNHKNGLYYDEANDKFARLDAKQVTPEDEQAMNTLFTGFFRALAANDEDALTVNVANVMDEFLSKRNATKNDVIKYMKTLHQNGAESSIEFRMNNDWKVSKAEAANGSGYDYSVAFSVDKNTTNVAESASESASITTYMIDAKVSSEGKISTLKMKKIVQ